MRPRQKGKSARIRKAIRVASWLLPLLAAASCGPGLAPLNVPISPTPILFIYIVGQDTQQISGFAVNSGDQISPLAPASTATTLQPASVLVHPSKNFLFVANFGSDDVTTYKRNSTTGVITPLGIAAPTPVGTGPIALATDPKGQFLYVLNQGSSTAAPSISAFSINTTTGVLTELAGSPFPTVATPTAFAVSQSSSFLYVANGTAGTISAFGMGSDGTLSPVTGSPFVAAGTTPNISWVSVDPKGRFVYGADSLNNTIVGFSIQSDGSLSPLTNSPFPLDGSNPAAMTIDSTGSFLYVADQQTVAFSTVITGSVSALTIQSSGQVVPLPESPFSVGNTGSTFVAIDPTNKFLFNTNRTSGEVTVWTITPNIGTLTQLTGTPFSVGTPPNWIALSQ